MIGKGQYVWWWDPALRVWELFVVVDAPPDSEICTLRSGDGVRQPARRDLIPSATYELADQDAIASLFAAPFAYRLPRHRQEAFPCAS